MGTLSVSVPDDLKVQMEELDEVNWSAVARKAFEEKVKEVDRVQTSGFEDQTIEVVVDLEKAVRIRTGETDDQAL